MLLHTNMFLFSQGQHWNVPIVLDYTERHSVRSQIRSGFIAFSTVFLVLPRYTMLSPKLKSVVCATLLFICLSFPNYVIGMHAYIVTALPWCYLSRPYM